MAEGAEQKLFHEWLSFDVEALTRQQPPPPSPSPSPGPRVSTEPGDESPAPVAAIAATGGAVLLLGIGLYLVGRQHV